MSSEAAENGNINGSNGTKESSSSSAVVSIEDLYRLFGILADANDQAGQHVETYVQLLSGTKAGTKEKTLASQFITRFFKYFPKEMPLAIDAIFDLCEDDDVSIRKAAIKDLALVAKDCPVELLNRIADILTQLLQTDDQAEFAQVQASLLTVFKLNPKSTLGEIFNQIGSAELEEVRKRAIKFLVTKIPTLFPPVHGLITQHLPTNSATPFNKEFEELVVKHIKQALVDVDAEEFVLFVKLLASLPSMNTLHGKTDLVDIIMAQSELDKPFDSNDMERIMILLSCIQQAIPFFSRSCPSTKYVTYYIRNVLGLLQELADDNLKFEILKSLAELSAHYGGASSLAAHQPACSTADLDLLFNRLSEYLPKPEFDSGGNTVANATKTEDEKFNFSYVECLLYAFHAVVRHHDAYLTAHDEVSRERAREFRLRLQYFAKGTQNYIKELRNSLLTASIANNQSEENKIRRVALKVTTNIDILIKDFFQNPPSFKNSITLSWKSNEMKLLSTEGGSNKTTTTTTSTTTAAATTITPTVRTETASKKRALSTDSSGENGNGNGAHKKKPERGIYQPPSGKYSTSVVEGNNGAGFTSNKRRTASSGAGITFNRGRRF